MLKIMKYLCPHYWAKRNRLSFYSSEPHCELINPIIESHSFKRCWLEKARNDFNAKLVKDDYEYTTSGHRCLGLIDLFKQGFIVKTGVEFAVETTDNDDEIKLHSNEGIIGINDNTRKFNFMRSDLLSKYSKPWGANQNVIKYHTPWMMEAPKDIVYIVLPIYLGDDNRFMASAGIQDPSNTVSFNCFLWWYPRNSYEVVRKDTPICQLIPIKRDKVYKSWKMFDKIPEYLFKKHEALVDMTYKTKCPHYSEFKKMAQKIDEKNERNLIKWME
jgi:hypothetical protein